MRVKDFAAFITKREQHRLWREGGKRPSKPDPIISLYRFCNVRRNDDRVTKWIHENYLAKWRDDENLWFALMVARLFNLEATLQDIIPWVLPFNPKAMKKMLGSRKAHGLKVFNAAYIVSTNGVAKDKITYIVDDVLAVAWAERKAIARDIQVGQLVDVHMRLCRVKGMASFMAAQVVADLKYAHPNRYEDFETFCASGPGSKRGLNRVMGLPVHKNWNEAEFRATLAKLRDATNMRVKLEFPITAQDIQNCLCEFDKYERARLGEGVPKQNYHMEESA